MIGWWTRRWTASSSAALSSTRAGRSLCFKSHSVDLLEFGSSVIFRFIILLLFFHLFHLNLLQVDCRVWGQNRKHLSCLHRNSEMLTLKHISSHHKYPSVTVHVAWRAPAVLSCIFTPMEYSCDLPSPRRNIVSCECTMKHKWKLKYRIDITYCKK